MGGEGEGEEEGWGTWEELILGGAVLRQGTADWNLLASLIRSRIPTPTPFNITPQACKERFEELQKRYSCAGSTTGWFDELRKRRVADLKQQLAKSENSIGSLDSKIKYLEKQRLEDNIIHVKFPEIGCVIMRKKRSQRKKESIDDHNHKSSSSSSINEIFKSVAESEAAAVFKHRMDSQKRARYRRVIKQHMDIGSIRSRMMDKCIKSAKELFRDLLLVANNALVFYSRRTREYKSALSLRVLVMKEYNNHLFRELPPPPRPNLLVPDINIAKTKVTCTGSTSHKQFSKINHNTPPPVKQRKRLPR